MKKIPATALFSLILATLLFSAKTSFGQKEFLKLQSATDSSYGYTALNPLRMKKGNPQKSITYFNNFLMGLRTMDGQMLTILSRTSTDNPNYKEQNLDLNNPFSGDLGFLDRYDCLTSNSKDTVTLYVDIYNKGPLRLPVGLKYEQTNK